MRVHVVIAVEIDDEVYEDDDENAWKIQAAAKAVIKLMKKSPEDLVESSDVVFQVHGFDYGD